LEAPELSVLILVFNEAATVAAVLDAVAATPFHTQIKQDLR